MRTNRSLVVIAILIAAQISVAQITPGGGGGGGGSTAFSAVTPGTNTGALVIGTGGSFTTSGTGYIAANSITGQVLGYDTTKLAGATWDARLSSCFTAIGANFGICNMHGEAATSSSNTPLTVPANIAIIWPHTTLTFSTSFVMNLSNGNNVIICQEDDFGCIANAANNGGPGIFAVTTGNVVIRGMGMIGGQLAIAGGNEVSCAGGTSTAVQNVIFDHNQLSQAGGNGFALSSCSNSKIINNVVKSAGGPCASIASAGADTSGDKILNNYFYDCNTQQLAGNGDINVTSAGTGFLHDYEIAGNYTSNGELIGLATTATFAGSTATFTGASGLTNASIAGGGQVGMHITLNIQGVPTDYQIATITSATSGTICLVSGGVCTAFTGVAAGTYSAKIYAPPSNPIYLGTLQAGTPGATTCAGSPAANTVCTSDNGTTTTVTCESCSSKFAFLTGSTWTATTYKIKLPNTTAGKVCTIASVISASSLTITDSTCLPAGGPGTSTNPITALEVSNPATTDTGSSECIQVTSPPTNGNIHDNTCFNIGAEGVTSATNNTKIHDNIMHNVAQDSAGTGCYIQAIQSIIGGSQTNVTVAGTEIEDNKCVADSSFGVPAGGVANPAGNPGGSIAYCIWENVGASTLGSSNAINDQIISGNNCTMQGNGLLVDGFEYSNSSTGFATVTLNNDYVGDNIFSIGITNPFAIQYLTTGCGASNACTTGQFVLGNNVIQSANTTGVPVDTSNPTTIPYTDRLSFIPYSGGSTVTQTLPLHTTAGFSNGFAFAQVNNNSGTTTVTPTGPDTINSGGSSSPVLSNWFSFVYNNGSGWYNEAMPTQVAFPACTAGILQFSATAGFSCGATVSSGVITPSIRPASDSTTAVEIQNNAQTVCPIVVDTTNSRVNVGGAGCTAPLSGAAFYVNNDFGVTNTGQISRFNNVATTRGGVPSSIATINLTAQSAAQSAVALYTVPNSAAAQGIYCIDWTATVTTAGTTSSVLGGTTGFQLIYTDNDTSASVTTPAAGVPTAASNLSYSQTNAFNAIGTQASGHICINPKINTAITYSFGYTSVGGTAMVYALHGDFEAHY